jgi:penicillin amidase
VILANEPDLSLNLPSIWYVVQLNAPGINTFGASLPGAPNVIIGFNDSIAWGMTNAKRDVVDWYKIKFRNDKRDEYQYNENWLKTEKIVEEIKVREEDSVYDTIVYTHYGPVVYDRNFKGNSEQAGLSMRWTAHDASRDFKTLYQVNRAKNYAQFISAFQFYTGPPQNFAFASGSGDIAITIQGKFPVKWNEQGKFLMDGSDPRQEWETDIPYEHNATVKNPLRGFISSANQHPVDSTYPYYAYDYHYEYYRNRRINDRLKLLNAIKVADMIKLQNDNYNYRASESLPLMLNNLDSTRLGVDEDVAIEVLKKWDYFTEAELIAPTIYQVWWDIFYDKVWDEFESNEFVLGKPEVFNTIRLLRTDPSNKYFDIQSTDKVETAYDLLYPSLTEAISKLKVWETENGTKYRWYLYKNTRVNHILQLAPFSVDKIKIGGYKNIVNAASGRHGPSWRMVVELDENGAQGWGVYPGSQTGNPGNPMYAHMIANWATGKYYPLLLLKDANEKNENLIFTQIIEPEL